MIDPTRIMTRLENIKLAHRISEPDLFSGVVVGSEEKGDYDAFLLVIEELAETHQLERRVHDGDLWYRGRKA